MCWNLRSRRLLLYKRIAGAPDDAVLTLLEEEIVDRFGPLPLPTKHLFRVTRIKLRPAPLGVKRVDLGPKGGRVVFHPAASIDPVALVRLVQSEPKRYRFEGGERLGITAALPEGEHNTGPSRALRRHRGQRMRRERGGGSRHGR